MDQNGRSRRILIVSGCFPPYNVIGAVRVGKMAKYLLRLGHDVRVLTVGELPFPRDLEVEIPEEYVVRTPWINLNRPAEVVLGGRHKVATTGFAVSSASGLRGRLLRRLGRVYKSAINLPDDYAGWYPYAVRFGERLLKSWRPDVIYSSALPITSHLVARKLAHKYDIAWIAEFRDLWVDSPYYSGKGLRRWIDSRLERWTLECASGLVTVSEVSGAVLSEKYGKPVSVIHNGFDPEDYPTVDFSETNVLRITYTGMIYEGKRDPSPLFEAISMLGPLAESVKVSFYGRYQAQIPAMARRFGVERSVQVCGVVPHKESIRIQMLSDVLLLLLWDDPREKGTYTGKLYEYLGARRPILVIGSEDNVAARLVQQLNVGFVSTDPVAIRDQLRRWLLELDTKGRLNAVSSQRVEQFTRPRQAKDLANFITQVLS